MHSTIPSSVEPSAPMQIPSAARTGLGLLQKIRQGSVLVRLPDGQKLLFGQDLTFTATIELSNWNVFEAVLKRGDVGLAESYMHGDWHTPNLADLLRVLIANRNALESLVYGSWWGRLVDRVRHVLRRNTKANSRKNIHAHYDLGNALYQLWLDPSMNYSSAWFAGDLQGDFTQAQHAKVRRALTEAGVAPGSRVLEIGCGWGALAEMAAGEFQADVVGVTLSTEQLAFGEQRMRDAGLSERVSLRLQDYRDIDDGPYDAICSIEMLEAVGQAYWSAYFDRVQHLLKRGGKACIQSIVIDEKLFDRYIHGTDFIQQYIFPGGCLPSISLVRQYAEGAGLRVEEVAPFGQDYAETLRRWHLRFKQQRSQVQLLGYDQRFLHMWEFYLAYCEAAFSMRNIDVVQFTLVKD